jgi:DNA repair exonuclease SbcCD nuclease subunit
MSDYFPVIIIPGNHDFTGDIEDLYIDMIE